MPSSVGTFMMACQFNVADQAIGYGVNCLGITWLYRRLSARFAYLCLPYFSLMSRFSAIDSINSDRLSTFYVESCSVHRGVKNIYVGGGIAGQSLQDGFWLKWGLEIPPQLLQVVCCLPEEPAHSTQEIPQGTRFRVTRFAAQARSVAKLVHGKRRQCAALPTLQDARC